MRIISKNSTIHSLLKTRFRLPCHYNRCLNLTFEAAKITRYDTLASKLVISPSFLAYSSHKT